MLQIVKQPGQKVLELGCGSNRDIAADVAVDIRQVEGVDFTVDFENPPYPIGSDEFDCVLAKFVLEHVSFPTVPKFLQEVLRVMKVGGTALFLVPNTEAQMKWIADHPNGWDGKDHFTASSELLYGSQAYGDSPDPDTNSHRVFFTPLIVSKLFTDAGFVDVLVQPYNERSTDLFISAKKPQPKPNLVPDAFVMTGPAKGEFVTKGPKNYVLSSMPREEMFDKHYFNGGGKVGGYFHEGFRDFPVHNITFQHILTRKPRSVLEVGAGRGYLGKRLEDANVGYYGLEISKHCYLTRVCDNIKQTDICDFPWPIYAGMVSEKFDLCLSVATLEHIPMEFIPQVIKEMVRTCVRGLHGIDFGEHDDGKDLTHCSLFPKSTWEKLFAEHAPGWPVEIVDKESLEQGGMPWDVQNGDGKNKLNLGSFIGMHHFGWLNVDKHDLNQFAQQNGYRYLQHDLTKGIPFETGFVDLVFMHHFLEHLSYQEALSLLRDVRRSMKPTGALRIVVPDTTTIVGLFHTVEDYHPKDAVKVWGDLGEMNDGFAASPTNASRLWSLLCPDHKSFWDEETLFHYLREAGFTPYAASFRNTTVPQVKQLLVETSEMSYGGTSCFVDAVPMIAQ